jgi:YVTN family beta-propeller protein
MHKIASPSRLWLLAVTLAIVAAMSAGTMQSLVSSTPSGAQGHATAAQDNGIGAKEVQKTVANDRGAAESKISVAPEGGAGLDFGVVATVPLANGSRPVGVASDTSNGDAYVTEAGSDSLIVISGSSQKVIQTVTVGSNPSGVVFDPMYSRIFVANFYGDDIKVISSTSYALLATIPVGGNPVGLAYDSTNGNVYVTQQFANSTSEINGSTLRLVSTVGVGGYPDAAAFDAVTNDLYIANSGTANVSVLNTTTNTVTSSILVGSEPDAVAYDSGNGDVYVANFLSNNTSVISGASRTVISSFTVGNFPDGVAYNPSLSVIAVAAEGPDQVKMTAGQVSFFSDSTNSLISNVSVGVDPDGIAYNGVNGYEYVANGHSSNVSVIGTPSPPPYAVTFSASGLPATTTWSVTLAGTPGSAMNASITFPEPNGTYPYTVSPIAGYTAAPSSGSVRVDGFPVFVTITFSPVVYSVVFTESGLPNGTLWSVTLNGTPGATTSNTLTFSVGNGSFPFTVTGIANYSVNPGSGTVIVKGGPQSVTISFSASSSSSTPSGLFGIPIWVYVLIAVVIVAVVIGIVLLLRRRRPPTPTSTASAPSITPGKSS